MNLYYIPSLEKMINADHIIQMKFSLAHMITDRYDEITNEKLDDHFQPATLSITTTELVAEESCSYDGDFKGVTAISGNIFFLRSIEAEMLWDALKKSAYALSPTPSVQEKKEMGVPS